MKALLQIRRYFSARGLVALIAISLLATTVSAIGQRSLTQLNVAADLDDQQSSDLRRQIQSLKDSNSRLTVVRSENAELKRLSQAMPLSRSLAELINQLPTGVAMDRFSAKATSPASAAVEARLQTTQNAAQFKVDTTSKYFSSAHLTSAGADSILFAGTACDSSGKDSE